MSGHKAMKLTKNINMWSSENREKQWGLLDLMSVK